MKQYTEWKEITLTLGRWRCWERFYRWSIAFPTSSDPDRWSDAKAMGHWWMVLLPHCLLETEVVEAITSLGRLTNLHNQYSWELFILVVSVRLLLHEYPRAGLVTYEEINRQFDMLTYTTGTAWYVAAVNFWLRLTVSVNCCTLSRFDSLSQYFKINFDVIQFM